MRTFLCAAAAASLLTLAGCGSGSSGSPDAGPEDTGTTSTSSTPSVTPQAPATTATPAAASPAAARSTVKDAEAYAVQLEQVFFSQGYPKDLAGALKVAARLTNLELAPGNTIASYKYDASDREFQLCVENTSGAHSTYDTRPMTTIRSGKTGGCP